MCFYDCARSESKVPDYDNDDYAVWAFRILLTIAELHRRRISEQNCTNSSIQMFTRCERDYKERNKFENLYSSICLIRTFVHEFVNNVHNMVLRALPELC